MTALILHLSDIHIRGTSDAILGRDRAIASAIFRALPDADLVLIVVSGDIAFSGTKQQYTAAAKFLLGIKSFIQSERDVTVEFVVAPGNHDCDFATDQSVRNAVLKEISTSKDAIPDSLIAVCTSVQAEYLRFWTELVNESTVTFSDALFKTQAFVVGDKQMHVDSLNASWMSTLSERPGTVCFPFERYVTFKASDADLRIGVLHHPLNWYSQANYHGLRKYLHSLEDIIITGHEHVGNVGIRDEAKSGECAYVEGCALQTGEPDQSEFNMIEIRFDDGTFAVKKFQLVGEHYRASEDDSWWPLRSLPRRETGELALEQDFLRLLRDPGATLHHPDRPMLLLDDFYVFPDLNPGNATQSGVVKPTVLQKKKNAKTLTDVSALPKNLLLTGEENAGKTRLIYQLYSSFHAQNYLPLFLDGRRIRSSQPNELSKLLSKVIVEQYGSSNEQKFAQTDSARKILLVDDYDQVQLQGAFRERFHDYVSTGFHVRVFSAGASFVLNELFSGDALTKREDFISYSILPFGYERRGELVKKWNRLGITEVTPTNQLLLNNDRAEELIESARLQHIATTTPIMVLSLLQIGSSGITKEMHNSSFAHYFYFLIVGALNKAGVSSDDFARYLSFSMHLSWYVKNNSNELEISETQYLEFANAYSQNWTTTDAQAMLSTLRSARIIDVHGDTICFAYQYTYFYFLGQYSHAFAKNEDVQKYIKWCVQNLYVRECANTLLFLAHHSDNSEVLDQVIDELRLHFKNLKPVSFAKEDVRVVATLMSNAPKIVYRAKDPSRHRDDVNRLKDERDTDDGLRAKPRDDGTPRDYLEEVTSLFKTMEIAGVLLTNQFASLSREKKNAAIGEVFDAGLKLIRSVFEVFDDDPDRIVKDLAAAMHAKSATETSSFEAERSARAAIAWVLKVVSTAYIEKSGAHLSSVNLRENVSNVVASNATLSVRLIEISQRLNSPGRLPQAMIKSLIKTESDNPCVMSVLQMLVLKRLYMYETDYDDKAWALSTFQMTSTNPAIELAARAGRLPRT